jgi:hypothetical protein
MFMPKCLKGTHRQEAKFTCAFKLHYMSVLSTALCSLYGLCPLYDPLSSLWPAVPSTALCPFYCTLCLALCLLNRLGEYRFLITIYFYDCNRPLAPILRQRRCCLMYNVYWLAQMMYNGIKIPGIQSRVRTEYFLLIIGQWTKESEYRTTLNKRRTIINKTR